MGGTIIFIALFPPNYCTKSAVNNLLSLFYYLWRHKESFIWSEYAQLYEKDQKETWNNIVETTFEQENRIERVT